MNRHLSGKSLKDTKGMALLITIMVVSLLIGVTVQFSKDVRRSFFSSAAQIEEQRLNAIARSGVAVAATMLEADLLENGYDSGHDVWADQEEERFADLFDQGAVTVEVEDLSGRLQLNSLVQVPGEGGEGGSESNVNEIREILNHLLVSSILVEEREDRAREIIDSIIDWLDTDDEESDFGAESGYYRSLTNSYEAENGAIRDVDALLSIKGITPKILYGEGEQPGLADFVTPHGNDGKMNINTMPVPLLLALHPLMTEEFAEMLDSFRQAEENSDLLQEPEWYRNVPGFPGDIEFSPAVLTTKSVYFKVTSEGSLGERARRVVSIVERSDEGNVAIIETRME